MILDALVTGAEVTENVPMLEMLFRSRFRWRLRPRSVTGDAAYGTKENAAAVEKAGIRAYTALPDYEKRTPLVWQGRFRLRRQEGRLHLSSGRAPAPQGNDHREGSIRYAARPSACSACPLKGRCTKSPKGRWVRRSLEGEHLEVVRGYRDTEPNPTARP